MGLLENHVGSHLFGLRELPVYPCTDEPLTHLTADSILIFTGAAWNVVACKVVLNALVDVACLLTVAVHDVPNHLEHATEILAAHDEH